MQIQRKRITVAELADGYRDDDEKGVFGYGGRLNIRPPYQREFVYNEQQRSAVIDTLTKGYPLNVMYWAERIDGDYEIIDGQQRTISICQYITNAFSHRDRYFHNLTQNERAHIEGYELMVYVCAGTESDKLNWFKVINIAGETLTEQELRNAVYSGTWLASAKGYFSRTGCPAYGIANKYVKGSPIRQEYLETAIRWAVDSNCQGNVAGYKSIEDYMGKHQHDIDAKPLWEYFRKVIDWIESTFINVRNEMKGQPWGELYATSSTKSFDPEKLEDKIRGLFYDPDVTNKRGIYPYVLTGEQRHLNIRAFDKVDKDIKRRVYEKQGGKCVKCGEKFELPQMQADHITPWSKGGKTVEQNCQMLCKNCNRTKGAT